MVRKWLYLTTLNSNFRKRSLFLSQCGQDPNVNVTTYLEEDYPLESRLFRRQWSRRKHITSWLFLVNVLSVWSKEYRFHSLISKSCYSYKFFRYSYLTFNAAQTTHFLSSSFKGTEKIITSHWPKRVIRYINSKLPPKLTHFITIYSELNLTFASYNNSSTTWEDLKRNKVYMPVGFSDNVQLFPGSTPKSFLKKTYLYDTLFLKLLLQKITILRKILILITLKHNLEK